MNKKIVLLMLAAMAIGSVAYAVETQPFDPLNPQGLQDAREIPRNRVNSNQNNGQQAEPTTKLDTKTVYYPNANLQSCVNKYKKKNYTGCLQELFSLVKKQPSNAAAYYYMALAYSQIGDTVSAVNAYEKVLALNPNPYLLEYATKGRDCLTGGPACQPEEVKEEQDDLDKFINSPYGNGLSPELNLEVKQKQLQNFQETINKKEELDRKDIQKIKDFDNKKGESEVIGRIASADPSDQEILNAIKTLKDAGVTFSVQPASAMPNQAAAAFTQNPQMAEMSMLLNGNNNNNNNAMMNMLPYMMTQGENGKNMDPRMMQAIMMNSMMPDFTSSNNNNN